LTIYSGQPDAFDSEEVRLLSELADDLSFGLEALRKDVERRRAQADIVRLEAFHRGIVENVAEGTVILDPDGHFTYLNSAAETMLGYPAGSLLGRHWKAVVAPADHDFIAARRETRRPGEVDRYDVTLVHRDGEMLEVRVSATQLYEDGVMSGTLSVFSDVTTERKLQRRVELQERLAAVGQLAAGIAHDFNNIVGAMILFGEMLLAEEGLTESARDRIRLIVEQAHRAAELTQQILDFGRKSIVERRPIDLVRFLRDFERLVGRTLPQPIGVQIESDGSAFTISGDPGRLQQALLNLTLNARDAMPEGGRLSFQLEHLVVSEGAPPYRDMHPGPWVLLSVSDTGSGIPFEIQPHIFEPFFTTKPVGEGTGLGLSQVYGIVKQHDGYIDVHSGPGRGTSFLIYFPEMPAAPEMTEAVRADEALGSGETILVVEDDDAARSAIGETLQRMDYHVILAEDGARALESFDAAGDRIALVISDVVMPHMGGMELFRELRKRKPDVRALLVTGYPLGNDTRELLEAGNAGWIQKPFDSRTLGARIRRMLRPRPARQGPDIPE
jgi:PAS domain S-box-containing protein